jgi:Holliday junction resolvase RusA-like endonuclease
MTYRLRLDRWQPTPINQLMNCHWATSGRRKKVDTNVICGYCIANRIPIAQGPREVSLLITLGPKQRAPDPDSLWKSTLDALVHARMLIDDNRQYCRMGSIDFDRGPERSTLIELTNLYKTEGER